MGWKAITGWLEAEPSQERGVESILDSLLVLPAEVKEEEEKKNKTRMHHLFTKVYKRQNIQARGRDAGLRRGRRRLARQLEADGGRASLLPAAG